MSYQQRSSSGSVGTDGALVLGGGVLTLVGTALAWLSFSAFGQRASMNGIDMLDASPVFNGIVTALVGVVAVVLYLFAGEQRAVQALAVVAGVVVAGIAGIVVVAPDVALGGGVAGQIAGAIAQPGIGVFVTLVGGVLVIVGGALGFRETGGRGQRLA